MVSNICPCFKDCNEVESCRSDVRKGVHEQPWQITRKQGFVCTEGTVELVTESCGCFSVSKRRPLISNLNLV